MLLTPIPFDMTRYRNWSRVAASAYHNFAELGAANWRLPHRSFEPEIGESTFRPRLSFANTKGQFALAKKLRNFPWTTVETFSRMISPPGPRSLSRTDSLPRSGLRTARDGGQVRAG